MYSKNYLLNTNLDFDNAIRFRLIVSIIEHGKLLGNNCIKSHCNEMVTMVNGQQYNKFCEFRVVAYASFYEPNQSAHIL
ncbi:MAG: hypothetical protein JWM44_1007 [Bacilli bacterium]|nr:hypothetical protein [Bacilli bacterium]